MHWYKYMDQKCMSLHSMSILQTYVSIKMMHRTENTYTNMHTQIQNLSHMKINDQCLEVK